MKKPQLLFILLFVFSSPVWSQIPKEWQGTWKAIERDLSSGRSSESVSLIFIPKSSPKNIYWLFEKNNNEYMGCEFINKKTTKINPFDYKCYFDGEFSNDVLLEINRQDVSFSLDEFYGPGYDRITKKVTNFTNKIIKSWKNNHHLILRIDSYSSNIMDGDKHFFNHFLLLDSGFLYEVSYTHQGQPPAVEITKYTRVLNKF
jgi:hypothetical protein